MTAPLERGQKVAQVALSIVGAPPDFLARPGDSLPISYYHSPGLSTCALTVLACYRLAGCTEPEVAGSYRIGSAFAAIEGLAQRSGAWYAGSPRGPLLAGDAFMLTDAAGGDGHVGLVVVDQAALTDPLQTVEGGQGTGAEVGAFTRALRWSGGRYWMGQRVIWGVVRAHSLPIPDDAADVTAG